MRFLCSLMVLACLGIPASVLAQDVFEGIPVEPRPSEYLHWDAEAFAEFQNELEGQLRDGPGIFGTQFVYLNALPRDEDRHHDVQIIHRSGLPNQRSMPPSGTSTSSWTGRDPPSSAGSG